ncbi:hypothetical protein CDN99_00060 [Roseateles aquatilis]|uniref:histidine kinase n=2 Tax=Roseateles aquatilis TaxID=431061 RepID=A0A246JMS0_9BURK|nr:hypothetical protein CDN99_00060 [Roseateles aquatilis]
MALALEDSRGRRIGASPLFERREDLPGTRIQRIPLDDGRHLLFLRLARPPGASAPAGQGVAMEPGGRASGPRRFGPRDPFIDGAGPPPVARERVQREPRSETESMRQRMLDRLEQQRREEAANGSWFPGWFPRPSGEALAVLLAVLFLAVAGAAFPVVRRLTRRLESLKAGMEQFGGGDLSFRVQDAGKDEVAALATSFNRAAEQIETLLRSHKSLLANASHELRSPLARMKMAFAMLDDASPAQRARLGQEINTNIAELDALVEEVLLASRLEGGAQSLRREPVDLIAIAAESAAQAGAELEVEPGLEQLTLNADDRLLRRALRNLLENARRYGGPVVEVKLRRAGQQRIEIQVCDRGPGVPEPMRERIFEAFFRLPGHAEVSGGVGLGLNLVKQIATAHQGTVRCEAREGGGSCFVVDLPLATA